MNCAGGMDQHLKGIFYSTGGKQSSAEKTPRPASRPPEAWIRAQMLVFARVFKLFHHFRGAGQPSQARAWPGQPSPRVGPQNDQIPSFYYGFLAFCEFGTILGAPARN